jgi:hypothetical protein
MNKNLTSFEDIKKMISGKVHLLLGNGFSIAYSNEFNDQIFLESKKMNGLSEEGKFTYRKEFIKKLIEGPIPEKITHVSKKNIVSYIGFF